MPFPLTHQTGQDVILFPIRLGLLGSSSYVQDLVGTLGQIFENLLAGTSQKDGRHLIVNPVQSAVAGQFAILVLGPMLVQETERGARRRPSMNSTTENSSSSLFSSGVPVSTKA